MPLSPPVFLDPLLMYGRKKFSSQLMGCAASMLLPACALWLALGLPIRCKAGDSSPSKPTAVDYLRDVKPLLSKHCYACHGALKQKAGLRLDTASMMRKG